MVSDCNTYTHTNLLLVIMLILIVIVIVILILLIICLAQGCPTFSERGPLKENSRVARATL